MSWSRILVLVSGAVTAITQAVQMAEDGGSNMTWHHLLAVGAVALVGWAAKSPWDVSKKTSAERVETAKRNSIELEADE